MLRSPVLVPQQDRKCNRKQTGTSYGLRKPEQALTWWWLPHVLLAKCSNGKKLPEKGIAGSKIRMRCVCASFIDFLICSLEDWEFRLFYLKVIQWKRKKICVFAAAEHLLNTEGNWKETFSVSSIWNCRGVKEGGEWKCQFFVTTEN